MEWTVIVTFLNFVVLPVIDACGICVPVEGVADCRRLTEPCVRITNSTAIRDVFVFSCLQTLVPSKLQSLSKKGGKLCNETDNSSTIPQNAVSRNTGELNTPVSALFPSTSGSTAEKRSTPVSTIFPIASGSTAEKRPTPVSTIFPSASGGTAEKKSTPVSTIFPSASESTAEKKSTPVSTIFPSASGSTAEKRPTLVSTIFPRESGSAAEKRPTPVSTIFPSASGGTEEKRSTPVSTIFPSASGGTEEKRSTPVSTIFPSASGSTAEKRSTPVSTIFPSASGSTAEKRSTTFSRISPKLSMRSSEGTRWSAFNSSIHKTTTTPESIFDDPDVTGFFTWAIAMTIAIILILLKRLLKESCRFHSTPAPQASTTQDPQDIRESATLPATQASTTQDPPAISESATLLAPETSNTLDTPAIPESVTINFDASSTLVSFTDQSTSVTDLSMAFELSDTNSQKPLCNSTPVSENTRSKSLKKKLKY